MRPLLTILYLFLCTTMYAQITYTYIEPDPTIEAEKKIKEAYFSSLKLSASKTLENCLRGCGHYDKGHAHDANDPDPCHHSSSQMQCECNCAAQNKSTLSDIDKQEQNWLRTVQQRQKDWENKKIKEQQQSDANKKIEDQDNTQQEINQSNISTINDANEDLGKTLNKSIEDAFNIIQESLSNNKTTIPQEEVVEKRESKIITLETIQLNELSSAPTNKDANDGYFNIRTISGIAYFVNKHSDVDKEETTCNPEGNLHLVWTKQADENQLDSFYVDI